jgi:hypothetical protein
MCYRKARSGLRWRLPSGIFRDTWEIVRVVFLGATVLPPAVGNGGSTINVQLHSGVSNPIYVNAGAVTIDYSYLLAYSGRSYATGDGGAGDGAGGASGDTISVYNSSGQVIATLPVGLNFFGGGGSGTIIWNNPVGQYIRLGGDIFVSGYGHGSFENWYITQGQSFATGGDTAPGGPNTTPASAVTQGPKAEGAQSAPTSSPNSNSPPAPSTRTNIHAVIISGLPDPAKVITSPNVTLTGGIAALGRDNAPLW